MDYEEDNVPFLPKAPVVDTSSSRPTDPNESYYVVYNGESLFIDTKNWRFSTLLKCQILMLFYSFTLFGMVDQAVGTLIPVFQKVYKVNDIETSLIFLSSIIGYIVMGVLNGALFNTMGLRGIFLLGPGCMVIAYTAFSFAPPFWGLVIFAMFSGIGLGSMDGAGNSWISQLIDSNQILGLAHGCYGLGCMISPALISNLIERKVNPWKWNDYYKLLATLALINCIMLGVFFKYESVQKYKYTLDLRIGAGADIELGSLDNEQGSLDETTLDNESDSLENELRSHTGPQSSTRQLNSGADASLKEVLQSKLVWAIALILFFYVGIEFAFGAWLVSYLLRLNHLSYKVSSYIATTFWSGVMVGRVFLGFVTAHYFRSELTANLVYIGGAIAANILFYIATFTSQYWLFFVFVFFCGLAAGPIFPTTIVASSGILPPQLHTSGVGFACAFGGGGAAALPFIIGLVAESSAGLRVFPLLVEVTYVALFVSWLFITKKFLPTYKRPGA